MIYSDINSCRPVLLRVNILVVCLMFRTSSTTILSTFKVVMIINSGLQTVHLLLLFTVILNLRYLDNESLLCLLVLDALFDVFNVMLCFSPLTLCLSVCLFMSRFSVDEFDRLV